MNYITFDIETYTPGETLETAGRSGINTTNMRVSTIGAYFSWIDQYLVFWEDQAEEFMEIMQNADLVIGFNHVWFDLPVMQKYAKYPVNTLPIYDLMLEFEKKVGYKIKLNDLAKSNLPIKKTDTFSEFRTYHLKDEWFKLADYCMHDVKITEDLFRMILAGKPLKYADMLNSYETKLDKPNLEKSQNSASVTGLLVEELF